MSTRTGLAAELQQVVTRVSADLRVRLDGDTEREAAWRNEHRAAVASQRTSAVWSEFVDERLTQAAVAWVLMTVFVRFGEDNDLLGPTWITGPGPRRQQALEAQQHFVRQELDAHRDVTEREWLQQAVDHLAAHVATRELVGADSPLRLIAPSGDGARMLLEFWRERDEAGGLLRSFTDPACDTRFLGDLYQDLSESARKRYALLQTPVFVEDFILDRTMEPALRERDLDGFRIIDPTCGSGHFLLGAFARLLDRWQAHAPSWNAADHVRHALDAIHGVDLNPFAVAITRFRLTVAALTASGGTSLDDAPEYPMHLAVGDSLLHGTDQHELDFGNDYALYTSGDVTAAQFTFATENYAQLQNILANERYDCVVGNPPYITVSDKAANKTYRGLYASCKGTYQLTVPFAERFFRLAKSGERAGWVGQITSNAFMKREFGSKLIEKFFPTVDLRLVADTSGAYIPGHGTPTVILVGRNQRPASETVRAVLGVRGEPGRPEDAAKGIVWTALVDHVDDPGWSDEWITVADLERGRLAAHPWSLAGGGAAELQAAIEACVDRLSSVVNRIGFFGIIGSDDAMVLDPATVRRRSVEAEASRSLVVGDIVRDYGTGTSDRAWFPYEPDHALIPVERLERWGSVLWPVRTTLRSRPTFGGGTYLLDGRPWWEWHQLPRDLNASKLFITFAEVATHNHFVLDRGGSVFKQTAPVIKLVAGASETDHLRLLGVLNSSISCFWLKQVCYPKGGDKQGGGARVIGEPWEDRYQHNAANVADLPLPPDLAPARAAVLDGLAQERAKCEPSAVCAGATPSRAGLDAARQEHVRLSGAMIAQQEELDWDVYRRYGLVEDDLTYAGDDLPALALGERAFEIVLARRVAAGEEPTAWFTRHRSTPITEIPTQWPEGYRQLVQRRIELATEHPYLRLLEKPEHKRRWASETWEAKEQSALATWLLDTLEQRRFWFDAQGRPAPRSVANLADEVGRDAELLGVLHLWVGRPDERVTDSLLRLLKAEAVPYLAAHRYSDAGLRKRAEWEHVWELQRIEDSTGITDHAIPVPPKYAKVDFRRPEYWPHRGKLDVPKERFIGYPGAERGADTTPVLGWAGWDHAEQALALAALAQQTERDGAADEIRVPLLAGLVELLPWLRQWHGEPDEYGQSAADDIESFIDDQADRVGRTRDELAAWRPPTATRVRRRANGNGGAVASASTLDADEG